MPLLPCDSLDARLITSLRDVYVPTTRVKTIFLAGVACVRVETASLSPLTDSVIHIVVHQELAREEWYERENVAILVRPP